MYVFTVLYTSNMQPGPLDKFDNGNPSDKWDASCNIVFIRITTYWVREQAFNNVQTEEEEEEK